ncbi:MAG: hypothetical protein E6J28_11775 [Chloroflexi bacterium]|nr:MAG: hypothetical protein E6J28_11775 [Chloroflexota bacterium]
MPIDIHEVNGPMRVLAGPGTGKTHALVDLYEQAVRQRVAGRDRILVLTFSNSAAGEIARRIDERLSDDYGEAWISTFHSFCARLLRDHAPDRDRLLINGFQEWIVMRKVLADIDPEQLGSLDEVRRSEAFAHDMLGFVALMKQNLVHPASLLLAAEASSGERLRALAAVFQTYQGRMEDAKLVDFRDLISDAVELLQSNASLRERLRTKFALVLVDEFQDVDPAQFELLRLVAPPDSHPRLVVVGDPDQSIYGFRGTVPRLLSHDCSATTSPPPTAPRPDTSSRAGAARRKPWTQAKGCSSPRSPAAHRGCSWPNRRTNLPPSWSRARATPSTRPSSARARSSVSTQSGQGGISPISRSCCEARPRWVLPSKRRCARSESRTRCAVGARPRATRSSASSSDTSSRCDTPTTTTPSRARWHRAWAGSARGRSAGSARTRRSGRDR